MDNELPRAFFPEGILDYFEVLSFDNDTAEGYLFYLREMNISPEGYIKDDLESKGFYKEETITDFPLRGKRCKYKVKRRRWLHKENGSMVKRDWNLISKGTRMTAEFATFLKGINR
jgi:hypothetical protein